MRLLFLPCDHGLDRNSRVKKVRVAKQPTNNNATGSVTSLTLVGYEVTGTTVATMSICYTVHSVVFPDDDCAAWAAITWAPFKYQAGMNITQLPLFRCSTTLTGHAMHWRPIHCVSSLLPFKNSPSSSQDSLSHNSVRPNMASSMTVRALEPTTVPRKPGDSFNASVWFWLSFYARYLTCCGCWCWRKW